MTASTRAATDRMFEADRTDGVVAVARLAKERPLRPARGAALVEFAVVMPLLLVLLFGAHLFADLLDQRLDLLAFTRFLAWEHTARGANDAETHLQDDAAARFQAFSDWSVRKEPVDETRVPVRDAIDEDDQGRVTVHARAEFSPAFGSIGVGTLRFQGRTTLVAEDWHVTDGADATTVRGLPRAGVRRESGRAHELHRRVSRLTFLGVESLEREVPGFDQLSRALGTPGFAPMGTYVVSHAYGETARGDDFRPSRGCERLVRHPAKMGLQNLDEGPGVDHPGLTCFDTSALRDTHDYDDSRGLQQFLHRGPYFLGCKRAQVDGRGTSGESGVAGCGD